MGFELWFSKNTGIQRKGTTFSELQNVFIDNITSKFIYEPLACCSLTANSFEVKRTLEERNFDVLGVIDENKNIIGFVKNSELEQNIISNYLHPFSLDSIISVSTPLSDLIDILAEKEYVFILVKDKVEGIVTRADINKPLVRIYLFGLISLFELHLNYWINTFYPDNEWNDLIKKERIEDANNIFSIRKGNNNQLTLLECIQFSDKKEILRNTKEFITKFQYSKKRFKRILEHSETLRNELAHSQNSIIDNLEWKTFIDTINEVKMFLETSENFVTQ